jgi:hypothetical protein
VQTARNWIVAAIRFLAERLPGLFVANLPRNPQKTEAAPQNKLGYTPMEITVESIKEQIPYYLTEEMKNGIVDELKKFPDKMQYYLINKFADEILQGDGWTQLQVRNFDTGEKIGINGIIISNTCDVSPENKRDLPTNILFAPLMPLDAYEKMLEDAGISKTNIRDKIDAIRRQVVTSLFFVPSGSGLQQDHIAILDDVHTMPAAVYLDGAQKMKIFTLSQSGFWLFVLKLSIHFCRFHENVIRA